MNLVVRPSHVLPCLALALSATFVVRAGAASIQLAPVMDNTLIESPSSNSNGEGDGIYVGRTSTAGIRRGLLQFDLSAIPSGSTISSVTLVLRMSMTAAPNETDTVHRLLADWGEAGSNGLGSGSAAQPGDATWLFRFFNTNTWTAAGGDHVATPSASQVVGAVGSYAWSGSGLVADVQFWVDNPSLNFGWMLKGPETTLKTAKKFDSREGLLPPELTINYTSTTGVPPGSDVTEVEFAPPSPVPAHGAVNLSFALPRSARVMLAVHDVAGRLVRHLIAGADESAGPHTIVWDGRVDSGDRAPAGIYIARLVVDGVAYERRMTQLR